MTTPHSPRQTVVVFKVLCFAFAIASFCSSKPAFAQTTSIADYFSNCAHPSAAATHTLIVDPNHKTTGGYWNIAMALKIAKPGDRIELMTGNYGHLLLHGVNEGGFITIAAANGQMPKFSSIFIGATSLHRTGG